MSRSSHRLPQNNRDTTEHQGKFIGDHWFVDLDGHRVMHRRFSPTYTCDCYDWSANATCKHVRAARRIYSEQVCDRMEGRETRGGLARWA